MVFLLSVLLTIVAPSVAAAANLRSTPSLTALGEVPLYFEANEGQADRVVEFMAHGPGHTIFLTPTEAVFVLTRRPPAGKRSGRQVDNADVVRMAFVGGDSSPPVSGREPLPAKANYFIGDDPAKWRTGVPTYAKVHYRGVYPGVDVVFYGNQRQLAYDIVIEPGADPSKVALRIDGAERLDVDDGGDLLIRTAGGTLRQRKPVVYREVGGVRRPIAGVYVVKGEREVAFKLGDYDRRLALVIDPVLVYSTYLGGSGFDQALGLAVDGSGNAYVVGSAASTNFPTMPVTSFKGGQRDAFLAKINPSGSALVYATYLGGSAEDHNSFGGDRLRRIWSAAR